MQGAAGCKPWWVKPGKYGSNKRKGAGNVNAFQAVAVDEDLSDDELRSGNDQA